MVVQMTDNRTVMKGSKKVSCMRLDMPRYNGCRLKYDEAWDRLLTAGDNDTSPGCVIIRPGQ